MIRTRLELIQALQNRQKLFWSMGNRPSDPHSYSIESGETVHGMAVNAMLKRGELKEIYRYWSHGSYRLKL
jgi:hypothetical protein